MQDLEAAFGESIDLLLRRLYVDEALTVEEVGERIGKTKGTVSRWLERFDIPTRGHGYRRSVA